MSFAARLKQAEHRDTAADTIAELARDALAQGEEERALPLVAAAAEQRSDPLLWQWAALLNRSLDQHALALDCFATAAALAPADARIAHGYAHTAFEAGLDATTLFEQARRLAPDDPTIILGLTAARMAAGQPQRALPDLEALLERAPLWVQGHLQFAQMQSLLGNPSAMYNSLDRAIAGYPGQASLWLARCDLALRQETYEQLPATIGRAEAAGMPAESLDFYRAVAAGEVGDPRADEILSDGAVTANPALAIWRIRHLLRQGRAGEAVPLIDRELGSERSSAAWPYAATAWRLVEDPRSAWLEDQPGMVSIVDLDDLIAPIAPLAHRLRSLHQRSGQYLDQSVRGGSQTDGPLLSRIEPEIRKLRSVIVGAVERYLAQLPPADSRHPLLAPPRDRRIRFSGSWSVRLRGRGHHSNHVHPQGWISSALYVALPQRQAGEAADSSCLALGEPPAGLGLDVPPHTTVEPNIARLVLFPSWMWHGTRPFAEGERLTVAFDVALPH